MKGTYNGMQVTVLATKDDTYLTDQTGLAPLSHVVELPNGALRRVPSAEVSFECVSILEWVRSDAWLESRGRHNS